MGAAFLRPVPGPAEVDRMLARLAPDVLGWCRRLGGDAIDADEAAQEVLLIVARRAPELAEPDAIEPWAFAVTRNVVRRHRRRAWWRRWAGAPTGADPASPDTPESALRRRELARLVDLALDALPAAQREVLVLCLVEERSEREVAALLEVPEGTVKSRLRLAREKIRAAIAADDRLVALRPWLGEKSDGR